MFGSFLNEDLFLSQDVNVKRIGHHTSNSKDWQKKFGKNTKVSYWKVWETNAEIWQREAGYCKVPNGSLLN
ncbi:hypothetical protein BpHYR1_002438 [Brachionus plicatilis]|uniref:Uncharacterized protein n=1 Tax=Brachionus plicatilis TaxID=10195 RepID=A0A3M7QWP7_BRAPC|nr:hypothetical protein BpHYR1_002438 [Brachionus plicatilis]